ncbi:helix-turn-helix transcriptional regulator [Urechidicola croceus]|uniref:AraC family transcriptional regulator n=1 Tax=Urechidicola croceus TaxID=1850246 RepID=A0A1D8PC49_9FLAO|nr:AraC family transcriptional regulator [Urechidicola croceus]AOW22115.1 AraC family transcriptional regulator [Urechidicola croceus]
MKLNIQKIQPYIADDIVYHADTCLPLVDAVSRNKLKFKALARYTYPGDRLTDDTQGISTVGYWDADEPQDWGLDWHRNEGIEFHFLESGSMPYSQGNEEIKLLPNHLTITRPWEEHKVGNPEIGMGKFYWVILDLGVRRPHQNWTWPDWIMLTQSDLQRLTTILRQDDKWLWKANNKIASCYNKLGKAVEQDKDGNQASKIRLIINELLMSLLEMLDADEIVLNESLTDSSRSVEFFLSELENRLTDNWTIEDMAESAGVGVTRFTHHCKKLTNLTPIRYLTMRRLEMSKLMLVENENLSIAEVAYSCGFATGQYFSTVFRRHEKCTPLEYKNKFLKVV